MIEIMKCIPTEYNECLAMQRKLNEMRNEARIPDTILVTEHDDTYTAGIHFKMENLNDYSVPIIRVERGGALTYHGKGQLILYFIFNLNERGMNVKDLILKIQDAVVQTLAEFGLKSEGRLFKETGVWTNGRKICSIGLALKGFSTFHGIALNVTTDLSKFAKINPCDFDASVMTSLEREIGTKIDLENVLSKFLSHLKDEFGEELYERHCEMII